MFRPLFRFFPSKRARHRRESLWLGQDSIFLSEPTETPPTIRLSALIAHVVQTAERLPAGVAAGEVITSEHFCF